MLYELETSDGNISIAKNVIGRIVIQAVKKLNGKVLISNHRGKVPGMMRNKISGGDVINNIDISPGAYGIDIKIYVVINFGTSIGSTTNNLIEEVHNSVKEFTGIELNSVAIVVTGMISKQQMTRRNIEVKG